MTLRSPRERVIQTLSFEIGGLILVTPAYALIFGRSATGSFALMVALSGAVMIWSPLHNTIFDRVDLRLTGRLASDRPHGLRVFHAVSHEASAIMVTLPIVIWYGGHALRQALALEFALTVAYTVYAYLFHLAYDRVRPIAGVGPARRRRVSLAAEPRSTGRGGR